MFGKPNIEKMKQKRDVKGVCKALGHKDKEVRNQVGDALVEMGKAAVEPLIGVLANKDLYPLAMEVLGKIGGAAVAPLIVALNNKKANLLLREHVVHVLGNIKDPHAVGCLITILSNEGEDYRLRCRAAEALGLIRDNRAVEPLLEALKDPTFALKIAAAQALGLIGDRRAFEPLISLLDNRLIDKRKVIEALGELGDKRAVYPLIKILRTPPRNVRSGAINDPFPALDHFADQIKREAAAIALGKIGGAEAAEALMMTVLDQRDEVSATALQAWESIQKRPGREVETRGNMPTQSESGKVQKFICSECGEEIPNAIRYEPRDLTMRCSGIARQCSCGWTCCIRCDPTFDQPDNGHVCPKCGQQRAGWVRWDPHRNMIDRSGWTQIDGDTVHWIKGGLWGRWKDDRESDRWTAIRRALAERLNLQTR